jgi:hypothetical protein
MLQKYVHNLIHTFNLIPQTMASCNLCSTAAMASGPNVHLMVLTDESNARRGICVKCHADVILKRADVQLLDDCGNYYCGGFANNTRHGIGTIVLSDSLVVATGMWKDGHQDGHVHITKLPTATSIGFVYTGNAVQLRPSGQGTFITSTGVLVHVGLFADGAAVHDSSPLEQHMSTLSMG